jgi:hypothetical protein
VLQHREVRENQTLQRAAVADFHLSIDRAMLFRGQVVNGSQILFRPAGLAIQRRTEDIF